MISRMFAGLSAAVAISSGASAQDRMAEAAADPIAAIQGEWVSRHCSKGFSWIVEGRAVKMYKHDPDQPANAYDNRFPEGATMMIIGDVNDEQPNGIRWTVRSFEPNGTENRGTYMLSLRYAPPSDYVPSDFFSLNGEMYRPETRAQSCG